MDWFLVFLAVAFLATLTESARFASDSSLSEEYDKIDQLLAKNVPVEDAQTNFAEIERLLISRPAKKSLILALENIIGLKNTTNPRDCNDASFNIIRKNLVATREQANNATPTRRIDKLVQHYLVEYNTLCYKEYGNIIRRAHKRMSETFLSQLAIITASVKATLNDREDPTAKKTTDGEICLVFDQFEVYDSFNPLNAIKASAAGDTDIGALEKSQLNETKVEKLFNEYLREPCFQYNERMGEKYNDIFNRIIFVRESGGLKQRCRKVAFERLTTGFCSLITDDPEFRKTIFNRMIKSIKQQA